PVYFLPLPRGVRTASRIHASPIVELLASGRARDRRVRRRAGDSLVSTVSWTTANAGGAGGEAMLAARFRARCRRRDRPTLVLFPRSARSELPTVDAAHYMALQGSRPRSGEGARRGRIRVDRSRHGLPCPASRSPGRAGSDGLEHGGGRTSVIPIAFSRTQRIAVAAAAIVLGLST